uniref:Putative salivary lipocalin n=1 Tax=Ixodes ricinus TaxID=34613 RepID=A0A0K8RGC7_IXORI
MYLQSLLAIFCLLIGSYSQDTAETIPQLPEDDPQNFPFQDATQMVELPGTHWVKRRTYKVTTTPEEPKCEYAEIHGKVEKYTYTLELGAKVGSRWQSQNQTLELEISGSHTLPNVLRFSRLKADGRLGHPLLYSDYGKCSIVRIKKKDSSVYVCDMLLLNEAADNDPPAVCLEKFNKYCTGTTVVEAYSSSCKTKGAEAL